ncbi:MAG: redoxin domain-containing protein [Deltaproteobacteria bacterium]|nr:redoxin domain-containing protein [Deltaproteobacteria bacterium]
MKNRSTFIILFLALALAGGYVFLKQHTRNSIPSEQSSAGGHPPVQAPKFALKDIAGDPVIFSDYLGKAVVINFFATWCPPCKTEIPGFVKIYNQYRNQGLEIIGISLDSDPEKVLPEFISELNINYSVAIGTTEMLSKYGGVQSIPTTFFINRKGEITNVHMGFLDVETFEREAKKIL